MDTDESGERFGKLIVLPDLFRPLGFSSRITVVKRLASGLKIRSKIF